MAHLVLLRTSPRVAPGQLTAAAWRLLSEASVVASAPGHAQVSALASEGIQVVKEEEAAPEALAVRLRQRAAAGGATVWLCGPSGDPELVRELGTGASVEDGSLDVPGARILDLVAVMDRLRSPGGCPWDAAQTHTSLLPYLLEEAYETAEAVETGDRPALREELGDVLLQVAFHARLAEEHPTDPWDVDDVASDIVSKLISRHPHVFAAAGSAHSDADSAAEVEANWETIKRAEKGRTSAVDGVPLAQPALALAAKLMSRAEKAGLDVALPDVRELNPQLRSGDEALKPETGSEGEPLNPQLRSGDEALKPESRSEGEPLNPQLRSGDEALKPESRSEGEPLNPQLRSGDQIGDLLLAVVGLARASGVDPEAALRASARRYADAIRAAESPS